MNCPQCQSRQIRSIIQTPITYHTCLDCGKSWQVVLDALAAETEWITARETDCPKCRAELARLRSENAELRQRCEVLEEQAWPGTRGL